MTYSVLILACHWIVKPTLTGSWDAKPSLSVLYLTSYTQWFTVYYTPDAANCHVQLQFQTGKGCLRSGIWMVVPLFGYARKLIWCAFIYWAVSPHVWVWDFPFSKLKLIVGTGYWIGINAALEICSVCYLYVESGYVTSKQQGFPPTAVKVKITKWRFLHLASPEYKWGNENTEPLWWLLIKNPQYFLLTSLQKVFKYYSVSLKLIHVFEPSIENADSMLLGS